MSGERLDPVHYLTCYLMTEPVEETLKEFYEHGRALGKVGRFHKHRRALMSGPFRIVDGAAAPRVLIRDESVPFRPHRGIYVIVEAAGAPDCAAHEAAVMAAPGVAGLWSFGSGEASESHPWQPGDERITVAWLDEDPVTRRGRHSRRSNGRGTPSRSRARSRRSRRGSGPGSTTRREPPMSPVRGRFREGTRGADVGDAAVRVPGVLEQVGNVPLRRHRRREPVDAAEPVEPSACLRE